MQLLSLIHISVTLVDRPCDEALPGYKKVNPMVYCGLYPADSAKYPDTWEVYVMRASELAKLAHYDEAIADYEKALSLIHICPS